MRSGAVARSTERGQEIPSVLMAGSTDGQRRPRLAEFANLVRNAISMGLRQPELIEAAVRAGAPELALKIVPVAWWEARLGPTAHAGDDVPEADGRGQLSPAQGPV
jgi:hypothetical protein